MPDQNINIQVQITDNSPEVLNAVAIAIKRALWAMGAKAEELAKTGDMPVDTGLLRNSITFAVGGNPPAITSYRADKPDKSGVVRSGSYSGTAPAGDKVYVGSNVEYAAAQENGTSRGIRAHHFLKNAVGNHSAEYKSIVKDSLTNV
jgi:hypothetical protein